MMLAEVVDTSLHLARTRSRSEKKDLIAGLLRRAEPDDAALAVSYLAGKPRQRRTGVGFAAIAAAAEPATEATLTLSDVDRSLDALAAVSGSGAASARTRTVEALLQRATEAEQDFLRHVLVGEVRHGALESTVVDAIAAAFEAPVADVRRAVMFAGGPSSVVHTLASDGPAQLHDFALTVGVAVQPMLAGSAPDVDAALAMFDGPVSIDTKLDGIRIQAHRDGDDVRLFTRSLDDITDKLPSVVAAVRALPCERAILDGEVISVDPDGRPRPFQETMSALAGDADLAPYFFDALAIDDRVLLDEPLAQRLIALRALVPPEARVVAIEGDVPPAEAQTWFEKVLADGHEGVVVKDLGAPYQAGRRGKGWVKVKPRLTLDLVVLAVEPGSGRRSGYLSNIHLGARDGDGFVMIGKTFKGMTDAMLAWQTARFTELAMGPTDGAVVHVRPEQVVEIAFDSVLRSSRYPGAVALRFARVVRYRDDKAPAEADTLDHLRALLPASDEPPAS